MKFLKQQQVFDFVQPDWSKDPVLFIIDQILFRYFEIIELAAPCFPNLDQQNNIGRTGMTLEQVIRCAIYKQKKRLRYRELSVHTFDSKMGIVFMKIEDGKGFSHQTLHDNISKLTPDVLAEINTAICKLALKLKIDNGQKMRSDTTTIETDIHYPTNCSLLWDCIRVSDRILKRASLLLKAIDGNSYKRSAKKTYFKIVNTSGQEKRIPLFKKMLKINKRYIERTERAIVLLNQVTFENIILERQRQRFLAQLSELFPTMVRVHDVAYRTEILEEKVLIKEKLFSIFETHTDYIKKGRRKKVFGHKIHFTSGKSNLIFDVIMERGNPNDTTYHMHALENIKNNYKLVPRDYTQDGGFASLKNLNDAKEFGVKNIVFSKSKGKLQNIVTSKKMETILKNWRSGIEAIISNLKRGMDARRCIWKGYLAFQNFVLLNVITFNLIVLANAILEML